MKGARNAGGVLTMLDLFSGIGGFSLAADWTGAIRTVAFCEIEPFCQKVLRKHWPDVPIFSDIKELRGEDIGTVDILTGGFPCQPFSVAGKQKGKRDDRYLWPEMLRVIREIKPSWVLGENVPGILQIAGKTVCEDLEREGYAVAVFNFEAAAVGAPHRRERVFFVANACRVGRRGRDNEDVQGQNGALQTSGPCAGSKQRILADTKSREPREQETGNGRQGACRGSQKVIDVADTSCKLREWGRGAWDRGPESPNSGRRAVEPRLGGMVDGPASWLDGYWRVEPDIPRVATGVKNMVDRLKCLGNAVVPAQVYPILQAIVDIETEAHEMITDKDGYHIEVRRQGREARLLGRPLSINWHPPGWLHDSFEAGWREVDEDPDAPKADIEQEVS